MQQATGFLRQVVNEASHGALLKGLALVSRALFLVFVAPRLLGGELATYVLLSSIAVLAGRALSLGLEEQLPIRIAGNRPAAGTFSKFAEYLVALELLLALTFIVSGSQLVVTALLTACYVTTSFMAGLLRTVRIEGSERLRDMHWIIFGLLALTPVPWTATQMLALMCASLMGVQGFEIWCNRRSALRSSPPFSQVIADVFGQSLLSWRKLFAGVALLAIVRGIILWPNMLVIGADLDQIAYALLLGEAFWQTTMVVVHRRYALYCVKGATDSQWMIRDVAGIILTIYAYAATVAVGLMLVSTLSDFSLSGFDDWNQVSFMVIFFASLSNYILLRYVVWVIRDFDWRFFAFELGFFLAQGIIVAIMPLALWQRSFALASIFLVFAVFLITRKLSHSELNRNEIV